MPECINGNNILVERTLVAAPAPKYFKPLSIKLNRKDGNVFSSFSELLKSETGVSHSKRSATSLTNMHRILLSLSPHPELKRFSSGQKYALDL